MVGATDHARHVIVNQSGQVKGLQGSLKNVEVAVRATKGAKASAEKALCCNYKGENGLAFC